ncbi:hypothetical protein AAC387_Pa09g1344 [Persea americana]
MSERLLSTPLRERRKYLKDSFYEEKSGYFEFAKEITVEADEARLGSEAPLAKINSFFEDAFNSSSEGIMVKSLDCAADYAASKRTYTWLKVKRDYLEGSVLSFWPVLTLILKNFEVYAVSCLDSQILSMPRAACYLHSAEPPVTF